LCPEYRDAFASVTEKKSFTTLTTGSFFLHTFLFWMEISRPKSKHFHLGNQAGAKGAKLFITLSLM
jgi:hypothetical protein